MISALQTFKARAMHQPFVLFVLSKSLARKFALTASTVVHRISCRLLVHVSVGKKGANLAADQYKMSFTSGGLFLNESVEMARTQMDLLDWNVVVQNALYNRVLMLPKDSSNRRTAREITNRLRCLTELEIEFLVNSKDRNDGYHILWVASCRAYKLVREFAVEVIVSRFQTYSVGFHAELSRFFHREVSHL
jgi:hypothetical protein